LGWIDARKRLKSGRRVTPAADGYSQNPRITIEHYLNEVYRQSLGNLTNYLMTAVYFDGQKIVSARSETPGWKGSISYVGGTKTNVVDDYNGDVYAALAQSWRSS
jgi:hypothetical protein